MPLKRCIVPVVAAFASLITSASADEGSHSPAASLSPQTLEALVSGIALYSDETIGHVLQAATDPDALHKAAQLTDEAFLAQHQRLSPSLQYLRLRELALLQSLDAHLSMTARLGVAARNQLHDVWAAIDRVRAQYATASEQSGDGNATTATASAAAYGTPANPYYPVYPAYSAYLAGLYTDAVIQELNTIVSPYATTIYTGPYGGSGVVNSGAVVYQNGSTTAAAGTANGVIYGPNGNSAVVSGQGAAAATTQGNTTYFGSTGSGAVSTSTGLYATGQHTGGGAVTQNADGSTSFHRDGSTDVSSSYGSTSVDHSGSGTATYNGQGSYQGSTVVDSTHGDATINTQAASGQVTSTVTTDNGQQTFTAGDGQVQHAGQAQTAASSSQSAAKTTGAAQPPAAQSFGAQFPTARPSSTTQSSGSRFNSGMARPQTLQQGNAPSYQRTPQTGGFGSQRSTPSTNPNRSNGSRAGRRR